MLLGNQGQRFGDLQRRQVQRRPILIDHARQISLGGGQADARHIAGRAGSAAIGRAFRRRRHLGRGSHHRIFLDSRAGIAGAPAVDRICGVGIDGGIPATVGTSTGHQ